MTLKTLRLFAGVVGLLAAVACKPDYPKCENDDHCKEKGEVCQNGQCQECREDAQCVAKKGEGYMCASGRCEVKPECRADQDCKDGLVCRAAKCVTECSTSSDCPSGRKCEANKCIAECANDVECGPGRSCVEGACVDPNRDGLNVSASCRPMSAGAGEFIAAPNVSFDFNKYDLSVDARQMLDKTAQCMREAAAVSVVVEGHGDERGTQEYNLALGEKRANTVRSYLKNLGIDSKRLVTRSKGENEPICREATEDCFSQNRRVQFIQSMK